jgi:hypothetical protein
MDCIHRRLNWRLLAVLALTACVAALILHPAPAHHAPFAPFVLLPLVLFGLVFIPRSLWFSSVLDQRLSPPVLCRTNLFQRPPPSRKR